MLERRCDDGIRLGGARFEDLPPRGKLGLQPLASLPAELGPGGVIGRGVCIALAGTGQRGRTGGVVAVLGLRSSASLGSFASASA